MALLQVGIIRLALLTSQGGGTKAKTLYLPYPSAGGISLEWEKKASTRTLIDGSERTRTLGFLPILKVSFDLYDDTAGRGYVIGTADGQRPDLESLLSLLSQPTGWLRVSPGISAGGFTVDSVQVDPVGKKEGIYTGVSLTFRGRDILSSMTLGAF